MKQLALIFCLSLLWSGSALSASGTNSDKRNFCKVLAEGSEEYWDEHAEGKGNSIETIQSMNRIRITKMYDVDYNVKVIMKSMTSHIIADMENHTSKRKYKKATKKWCMDQLSQ